MRNLSDQLRNAIAHEKLTPIYQAALVVANETDVEIKVAHKRLTRYLSGSLPRSLQQFVETCQALGYDVVLKKSP